MIQTLEEALKRIRELETENEKLAASLGYYYTPSYFLDGRKIYEATPHEPASMMHQRLSELLAQLAAGR